MAVQFSINGIPHSAKLGVAACKRVESIYKKSILEVIGANQDGTVKLPSIGDLSVLFWASLLHENPTLTQEQADDLLDQYLDEADHDLETLMEVITKALNFTKGNAAPAGEKAEELPKEANPLP